MMVAAFLLCCAGILVSVVSTGSRASNSLRDTTIKFIEKSTIHHGKDRIVTDNKEQLYVITERELENGEEDEEDRIYARGLRSKKRRSKKQNSTKDTLAKLLCFPSNSTGKSPITQPPQAREST